jgi:anti-anti-sigma factor
MTRAKTHIKDIKSIDGIYIIRLEGNFDINSTPTMCKAIEGEAKESKPKAVVLDFAGVGNIDSTAFACLISLVKYRIQDPSRIGVFNLNPQQRSLIEILQVHKIINIFPSEQEAVDFFRKS